MAAHAITLSCSSSGYTGLHEACANRNFSLVKEYAQLLIQNGNRAESLQFLLEKDGRGMSAMDIVARSGTEEGRAIFQLLQKTLAQLRASFSPGSSVERPPTPIPSHPAYHERNNVVPKLPIHVEEAPSTFKAIIEDDLRALSEAMDLEESPNVLFFGETLLTFATKRGDRDAVGILLRSPIISVNKANADGLTPYDIAVNEKHREIAILLQRYGGMPSNSAYVSTPFSTNAIKRSPRSDSLSTLRAFPVDSTSRVDAMPLIHEAVASGNHRILIRLLEEGADPNVFYRGQTPLMRAVVQRDQTSVRLLLGSSQIQPALQNPDGLTALEIALLFNNGQELVKLLLEANDRDVAAREAPVLPLPQPSGSFMRDVPPLFDAIQSKNNDLLLSRLMAGLNPNELFEGETPLTYAIRQSNLDAIKTLCAAHRVDVNRKNERGQTPLTLAVDSESVEIAALLVRKGADPELPNSEGQTPMALAASKELHLIQAIFAGAELLQGFTEEEFWETVAANQI